MRAGNARYLTAKDLPATLPVFPLEGALLLPGGRMPLNIFEPRYLQMVDQVIAGSRIIGMIQPALNGSLRSDGEPELSAVGCLGRITSLTETGDGRYLITLDGICRFRVSEEMVVRSPFRQCRIVPFLGDLDDELGADKVDREALLRTLRDFIEANDLQADWASIARAGNATLVNALSMIAPYGPAEKQALLEAPDLRTRALTLIAIAEISMARDSDEPGPSLQ